MARAGLIALVLVLACTRSKEPPPGLGAAVFAGPSRALTASADGAFLAFLDGCRDVRGGALPAETASCDLRVVPAAGGEARRIASAVSTLPHAVAWSPVAPVLAALADYEYPTASGALVRWDGEGTARLAEGVTFHGFGPGGELGFVAGGRLSVLEPGAASPRTIAGAEGVATFDVAPPGVAECGAADGLRIRLAVRRSHAAGGQLLGVGCELAEARALEAGHVGEYGFSRAAPRLAYTVQAKDGAELRLLRTAGPPERLTLARGAQAFSFAPVGEGLAFVADAAPGRQGDLHLAAPGERRVLLAREVGEFRWASAAPRLAWLERYDPRVRAGTLGAGGPRLAPRTFGSNVSDFAISPDGEHLAFLQHTTRGGYSVDLALVHVGAPAGERPRPIAGGAFGFSFSPDGRWLYYRTRCVRNAEACDLERIPSAGTAPGAAPELVAEGVKSFEFDPRDPGRLLLTWQRMDMVALDVAVWREGRLTSIDTYVQPGSARFLPPDSRRVAYAVVHPKRAGVYVADVPR